MISIVDLNIESHQYHHSKYVVLFAILDANYGSFLERNSTEENFFTIIRSWSTLFYHQRENIQSMLIPINLLEKLQTCFQTSFSVLHAHAI